MQGLHGAPESHQATCSFVELAVFQIVKHNAFLGHLEILVSGSVRLTNTRLLLFLLDKNLKNASAHSVEIFGT